MAKLTKFYSPQCGPCQEMAPEFDRAVKRLEGVEVVHSNVEEDESLAEQLKVDVVPTLVLQDGKHKAKLEGYHEQKDIEKWVQRTQKKWQEKK